MAQFHTHGTPPSVKQRSTGRRAATPAIAALIAGALISAPAWAGPPDAQFSAVASGSRGETIRVPGAVSAVNIGDFPDSGGTDSASTTTDLTAHARAAASSRGSAGGQAMINYYGEVVGPSTSPVPLSIVASLSTNSPEGSLRRLAMAAQLQTWPGESPPVSICSPHSTEGRQHAPAPLRAARGPCP